MPLPFPTYGWELCDLRSRLVVQLTEHLGPSAGVVIGYSEVARTTSLEDVTQAGPEIAYGANLQHALLLGRVSSRETGTLRMILVTYSLPSAHHVSEADVYFNYPPVPESLDAASREASSAASDGTRIDALLLVHPSDDEQRIAAHQDFFRQMSEQSHGNLTLVRPGDPLEDVAQDLMRLQG
jgi:uncharacterized protein with von Willebrand factor type A (vWA) domain